MNSHAREFLAGLEERFPSDSTSMTMSNWIERNTRLRKAPFSFEGYEFQRQIVDDLHPNMSVVKPSQVGLSEIQIRKFLGFLKRHPGTSGIFTLPNNAMRDRMSQTRVKPLVEGEPVFNGPTLDKPVRHKGLYQIDSSFGYFTGSTEGEATSIPADILWNDEVDLTDQRMLGLFQSRLQASAYRITQRFSTPTFYGYGIDATYEASDKNEYMIRCPSCRRWQAPSFHPRFLHLPGLQSDQEDLSKLSEEQISTIDMDATQIVCEDCSKPLDLTNPSLREWVAEFPSRRSRGYRVRPFCVPFITVPYIFEQMLLRRQQEDVRGFFNTVLGEPFNDSNARIGEDVIRACLGSPAEGDATTHESLFLGIDMGLTAHVVLGSPSRILLMRQVPQQEIVAFIAMLYKRFGHAIVGGCIDRYPYTPTAEEIRDLPGFRKVIMPIVYATHGDAAALSPNKDEFGEPSHFTANRTRMLDEVAKVIRLRQIEFNGYGDNAGLLVTHLRDSIRIEKPDHLPTWEKISGNDHYLHALGYHLLAVRMKDVIAARNTDPRHSFFLFGSNVVLEKPDPKIKQNHISEGPLAI